MENLLFKKMPKEAYGKKVVAFIKAVGNKKTPTVAEKQTLYSICECLDSILNHSPQSEAYSLMLREMVDAMNFKMKIKKEKWETENE